MEQTRIKRGAAYIRVSTKSDSQIHSFEFQEDYWRKAIAEMPDYELTAIFADRGLSGKSQGNRKQFQNMLEAARRREFDTVFTKSVSRFGRDTEELLRAVSVLKECDVNVIFESESIDTANTGSELYLTVAAAVAEDQLRSYGRQVRWMIRGKFKNGEAVIGRMYGYRLNKGRLEIIDSEADVVRLIFRLYRDGMGKQSIANELTERGIPTCMGNADWRARTIAVMLRNEKYCGRLLQQKSIKINGRQIRDQQVVGKYLVENAHEAIISRNEFEDVQKLLAERAAAIKNPVQRQPEYAFRSKIVCGYCGERYVHKINSSGTKYEKPMWRCSMKNRLGASACASKPIFDEVIEPLFVTAYNGFVTSKAEYGNDRNLLTEKGELLKAERKLEALAVKGLVQCGEYETERSGIIAAIGALDARIRKGATSDASARNAKAIKRFDGEKVSEYLDRAIIKDDTVTFEFINGYNITLPFSNGSAGNSKGWADRKRQEEGSAYGD
jgi:DNA invertase Pin-like site-specific DNA recombinase